MSPPPRASTQTRIEALVQAAKFEPTEAQLLALRRGVVVRLERENNRWTHKPVARGFGGMMALAAAAAIMLFIWRGPAPVEVAATKPAISEWSLVELPQVASIESRGGSSFPVVETASERQVFIPEGFFRATIAKQSWDRPVVLVTPHVRVVALGTRYDLKVDEDSTTVALFEGLVRVESRTSAATMLLGPGETLRSDALRPPEVKTAPPAPLARAAVQPYPGRVEVPRANESDTVESCRSIPDMKGRIACLQRLARLDGLTAQNALYLLAGESRKLPGGDGKAINYYAEMARRFPKSSLAGEGKFQRIEILRKQGKTSKALGLVAETLNDVSNPSQYPRAQLVQLEMWCEMEGETVRVERLIAQLMKMGSKHASAAESIMKRCRR